MPACRKSIAQGALALVFVAGTTLAAATSTIGTSPAASGTAMKPATGSLGDVAQHERIPAGRSADAQASSVAARVMPSRPVPSLAQRVGGQLLMALVVGIAATMLAVLFVVSVRPGKPWAGAFRSMKQMFNSSRE